MVELTLFKKEMQEELAAILNYWMKHDIDHIHGGFIGKIDHLNQPVPYADKGSVLNSRILWTFAAAHLVTKEPDYLSCAQRAYHYFTEHFIDKRYGGVYWTVSYNGMPSDRKKQVYAQAFAIYALSEYYRVTGTEAAKQAAITLYEIIERYSYDPAESGYIDAFAEDWSAVSDLRLSEKDANEKKTMNTHLHILEAYSNLYHVWPDAVLKDKIKSLLKNFKDHIIDATTGHLILFFDESWNTRSTLISFGHDIETAWLLQEAAETIDDAEWIQATKKIALTMAAAALKGLDTDGGIWYEYEPASNYFVKEKHWWPQAEAMVGFFNAWQISRDSNYLRSAWNSWNFIKESILDQKHGEWVWGVREDNSVMSEQDKAGIWKCPYHNGRACMEIIKRIR